MSSFNSVVDPRNNVKMLAVSQDKKKKKKKKQNSTQVIMKEEEIFLYLSSRCGSRKLSSHVAPFQRLFARSKVD